VLAILFYYFKSLRADVLALRNDLLGSLSGTVVSTPAVMCTTTIVGASTTDNFCHTLSFLLNLPGLVYILRTVRYV